MMRPLAVAAIYVAAVLAANATATTFLSLPGFGLVAVGTLVFGIVFTQRDRLHRYGRVWVYGTIVVTALVAAVQSLALGVPWRIIVASVIAILLAETTDTEVFHRLRRHGWLRAVLGSNAVSVPLDTVLFNMIAFTGVFPLSMLVEVSFGDIVAKFTIAALLALYKHTWENQNLSIARMETHGFRLSR